MVRLRCPVSVTTTLSSILTPPDGLKSLGIALVENTPFPDDSFKAGALAIGKVAVSAETDVELGADVKFSASGSAFAGLLTSTAYTLAPRKKISDGA